MLINLSSWTEKHLIVVTPLLLEKAEKLTFLSDILITVSNMNLKRIIGWTLSASMLMNVGLGMLERKVANAYEVNLAIYGPDHPEDMARFGGFTLYRLHYGEESLANKYSGCGSVLDEHGLPDSKYPYHVDIKASTCVPNVVEQNVPGKPEYGTTTYAHVCMYTLDLPDNKTFYITTTPHMYPDYSWSGCPSNELSINTKTGNLRIAPLESFRIKTN
jgi:hypothetical protein